ncbi:MAG TPA: ATPase, partial [Candidatus Komeilibacteria bacterium]|nr:ATPase [Candidatus Komeilibacteria bacterium]
LYPVTVLTSLTRQLNHRFREENIVLAVDLLKFTPQSLAKRFKISLGLAQRLISEVSVLIS